MYLVHYKPKTHEVMGYLDASQGIFAEDDGTSYFSVNNDIYEQYQSSSAWTDGKVITNMVPPNEFAELTSDGWVVNEEAQALAFAQVKAQAVKAIDDEVGKIYMRFQRFNLEYEVRIKQALTFKASEYQGEVPGQVAAYAEPAGITAKDAAIVILQQSEALHEALDVLGKLRMQKFAILKLITFEGVENHKTSVLNQIKVIGEQL